MTSSPPHVPHPPHLPANAVALLDRFGNERMSGLWVLYHDYSAKACARWVPASEVSDAIRDGVFFCRANLNFTLDDQQVPSPRFGADAGDFVALPDPETFAPVPYQAGVGRVLSYLHTEEGDLWEGCPRGQLNAALARLAAQGLSARVAFEPEFTLFRKGADGNYTPADAMPMYSAERLEAYTPLLDRIHTCLAAQDVRIVGMGSEYSGGQMEINLHHETPLKAADDLVTLRETVKALARADGLTASFMPKPFAHLAGNGVHVHLSLWDVAGGKSRSEGNGPLGLSPELAQFMAGVLAHAPALCGVFAPTVNSYKRLQPATWAPAHVGYGSGNRAALVRVPGKARRRIEFRAGDHTANPYLALTALIAAGLDGLARALDPGAEAHGDLGHLSASELAGQGIHTLPRSAGEALAAVEADTTVMAALGPVCGPELLRVKRDELARYEQQVSEWERAVYLERV